MDKDKNGDFLAHYGTPRHSGRYPWGSGKKYQRSRSFLTQYRELKSKGLTDKQIAEGMGYSSTSDLRARRAMAEEEEATANRLFIAKLKEKGMSNTAIAERIGKTEGYVRYQLKGDQNKEVKRDSIAKVADALKEQVEQKKFIDVGKGVNLYMGITESKLHDAYSSLQQQGYQVIYPKLKQLGTNHETNQKVLIPPGMDKQEAYAMINRDPSIIQHISDIKFKDNGAEIHKIHDPVSISSDRVYIRYGDQGGKDKDGVIELRQGVKDLDLGDNRYAQVRIAVDGTHFLKGMAIPAYDIPEGKDIIFNTNKPSGTDPKDVFKEMKHVDPHNPFGATINDQNDWVDSDGVKHEGALNIVNSEGSWDKWSRTLASQMLSKQPIELAKKQLGIAGDIKETEFEKLNSLTNPTLKKELLYAFADECDSAAVCLKAAAMPRQSTKVILPLTTISDKEIYAPTYENGEEVVLIRYPHGGRFEIPRLTVNNNNKEGKQIITPLAKDAVGINPRTAEILSGADFDGDSVVVIPTKGQNIKTEEALKGLKNYDPKELYSRPKGTEPPWKKGSQQEQTQMGIISNLITDMTLMDAPTEDICYAVRHSMTIIDTGKHNLDYKKSYEDNKIAYLMEKYRGKKNAGAATLISRASKETKVDLRDENRYNVDPETGKKIFLYKNRDNPELNEYVDKKTGKTVKRQTKSTLMYEADDAYSLSSGYPMETVYAEYANRMKELGNRARKVAYSTGDIEYSPSAAETYKKEVEHLKEQLVLYEKNYPLERAAQRIGNARVQLIRQNNPDMSKDDIKKAKNQALKEARAETGASRYEVQINDREWEAIQSGAVRKTTLTKLLQATDNDKILSRALPRNDGKLSTSVIARAKRMLKNNYTWEEVAKALDVSVSTLERNVDRSEIK